MIFLIPLYLIEVGPHLGILDTHSVPGRVGRAGSSSDSDLDKDITKKSVTFLEELNGNTTVEGPKQQVDKNLIKEGGRGNIEGRGRDRDTTQSRRSGRLRSQRRR